MGCRESTLRSFYGVAEEGYLHSKVRGAHHYPASRVSFKITILISRLEWVIAPWSISMNSLQRPVLVSGRCAAWLDNVNKWSFVRTILKTHNHHLTVLKTPAAAGIISKVLFHIHHHLFLVFLPFGQFCLFNLHILNRLLLYLDININEHKLFFKIAPAWSNVEVYFYIHHDDSNMFYLRFYLCFHNVFSCGHTVPRTLTKEAREEFSVFKLNW